MKIDNNIIKKYDDIINKKEEKLHFSWDLKLIMHSKFQNIFQKIIRLFLMWQCDVKK